MQVWIKFCPDSEIVEGKEYFIGRHRNPGNQYLESCDFLGRGLNKKVLWTQKPGIAIRAVGGEALREYLKRDARFKAVEIPEDADKRWRARKPRHLHDAPSQQADDSQKGDSK